MYRQFPDLTEEQEKELLDILAENIDFRYNNVEYWDPEIIEGYYYDKGFTNNEVDEFDL